MEEESIFLTYIRETLKKWVGFQVAIDEGMGGPYAQEKEIWLGTEIEKYFKTYKDVKPEDLEDYVAIMIDNEFDTYFEDGSLLETCKLFCKAYNMSEVDPNAPMFQALKRVPPARSRVSNNPSQSEEGSAASEVATTEDSAATTANNISSQLTKLEITDPEDEGWTVVSRKHKPTTNH